MDNLESIFNEIVRNYRERLYWHVRSLVCSHEDADDLLQDIFIKIWEALPTFRGDSQIYTWVYRIATNTAVNFLHKKKIRAALSFGRFSGQMESKIDQDPFFSGDDIQRRLSKAILRLPEKQRLVFLLRYYEDMTYEDMSKVLETSVGALKASYHFACEKIKKEIKLSL